jgi:hypothetical protein
LFLLIARAASGASRPPREHAARAPSESPRQLTRRPVLRHGRRSSDLLLVSELRAGVAPRTSSQPARRHLPPVIPDRRGRTSGVNLHQPPATARPRRARRAERSHGSASKELDAGRGELGNLKLRPMALLLF